MKDKIKTILENEELDASSKTDAIAKVIGEETVIKSKYNDKVAELQTLKEEKETVSTELETIKASTMSEADKVKKQEDMAKAREIEFLKKSNRLDAERLFVSAGMTEEDYKEIIDDYVSDNTELTTKRVTNFVNQVKKTRELTETRVKEDLLKETPRPNGQQGSAPKVLTKEDFASMSGFEKSELYKTDKTTFDKLTSSE